MSPNSHKTKSVGGPRATELQDQTDLSATGVASRVTAPISRNRGLAWFRNASLKTKLVLIIVLVCSMTLLQACVSFVMHDIDNITSTTVSHLWSLAEVLGANSASALLSNDPTVAETVLSSLRHEPSIVFACVYDASGKLHAMYPPDTILTVPKLPQETDGTILTHNRHVGIFKPITKGEEEIGTIYIAATKIALQDRLLTYAFIFATSTYFSVLLASLLQRTVSARILRLKEAMETVSSDGDYSFKLSEESDDEIGSLYAGFNEVAKSGHKFQSRWKEMLCQIQKRDHKIQDMNQQLLDTARRAGMAEVASDVLHNVGNVLTSVMVSTDVISSTIRESNVSDLKKSLELMHAHQDDLGAYMTQDERGRHLPRFLTELSKKMSDDEEKILTEINSLSDNIEHIKTIVSVQQSHANVAGLVETVSLPEIVADAVQLQSDSLASHGIETVFEFADLPPISVEKQKLLQIVVNVISNARNALIEIEKPDKRITILVFQSDHDHVCIEISDNGIGIPEKNLIQIFSHGFTTRKDGHGFGLHSASLSAKELSGSLTVQSDGPGTGATFTLEIPFSPAGVATCTI